MFNVNPRVIIQKYNNLREYYPELTNEELQKIEKLKSLLKGGKKHSFFESFFFKGEEELERKRISIIERASDILYQLLREERAYKNRDHELELLIEFPPDVYLSRLNVKSFTP